MGEVGRNEKNAALQAAHIKINWDFKKPAAQNVATWLTGHLVTNTKRSEKLRQKSSQVFFTTLC